jgi:hypothetical protein
MCNYTSISILFWISNKETVLFDSAASDSRVQDKIIGTFIKRLHCIRSGDQGLILMDSLTVVDEEIGTHRYCCIKEKIFKPVESPRSVETQHTTLQQDLSSRE